jgi:hypothetical protein
MPYRKQRWTNIKRAAWFLCGIMAVGVALCLMPGRQVPFEPDQGPNGTPNYGLAVDHAAQAAPIAAALPPFQITGENGERIVQDNAKSVVHLWDATKAVLGKHTDNYPQEIGDCVSFGGKNAIEHLLCVRIARDGPAAGEFHPIATAYLYGISRVQIGGGRIGGDGSVGAWLAKGVQQYGVLALDDPDVPRYSGGVAKKWGNRPGPPKQFIDIAKQRLVKTVSPIRNATEARDAICNGYPLTIASDYGSTDIRERDGQMVARRNTSWMHQMAVVGFDGTKGRAGRFYVLNSWGPDAHPKPLNDEPPGGFWIEASDMDYIAKQGDTWAFSDFDGFPARDLNFNVFGVVGKF